MYDRILVPTDDSEGSERVAAHAAELAATTGADLHAVYVVDESTLGAVGPDAPVDTVSQALEDVGRSALDRVEAVADDHGVAVTADLRRGDPGRGIVQYAEEIGADVVVMGTHGRKGLERYLLGSVTEHVLRATDRPVLAVKLDAAAVTDAAAAEDAAARALEGEGAALASLRDDPYRERATWVVPAVTEAGEEVNVHVDAVSGDARVAHLN
jgi:nucleotide-binding universal stress UspA family protein